MSLRTPYSSLSLLSRLSRPSLSSPSTSTGPPLDEHHHRPRHPHTRHTTTHVRLLHTSNPLQNPAQPPPDHYATLSLAPSSSQAEIKKSFYALSKKHHPDRTRSLPKPDAEAHARAFRDASEAYAVLGDPAARKKYDRERPSSSPSSASSSSHSSSQQQTRGGRPASGLSKRRTPFHGPPPSFYRSGGWGSGAAAEKRRQTAESTRERAHDAADMGTGSAETQRARADNLHRARAEQARREGGSDGWPMAGDANDVPHFDRRAHFRTTSSVEAQLRRGRMARREQVMQDRRARAVDEGLWDEEGQGTSEGRRFLAVGGVLVVGCGGSLLMYTFR